MYSKHRVSISFFFSFSSYYYYYYFPSYSAVYVHAQQRNRFCIRYFDMIIYACAFVALMRCPIHRYPFNLTVHVKRPCIDFICTCTITCRVVLRRTELSCVYHKRAAKDRKTKKRKKTTTAVMSWSKRSQYIKSATQLTHGRVKRGATEHTSFFAWMRREKMKSLWTGRNEEKKNTSSKYNTFVVYEHTNDINQSPYVYFLLIYKHKAQTLTHKSVDGRLIFDCMIPI